MHMIEELLQQKIDIYCAEETLAQQSEKWKRHAATFTTRVQIEYTASRRVRMYVVYNSTASGKLVQYNE